MSRLGDVLSSLQTAIVNGINNAGIVTPNQVGIGWPNFEDLTQIITAQQAQVTIYTDDSGNRDETRFFPQWMKTTAPGVPALTVTLGAVVSGKTITFSGTVPASGDQYNIHVLLGDPLRDVYVPTVAGDTPNSIAAKVSAAIIAAGLTGISASAAGAVTTVTGTPNLLCNVGGSATLVQEVLRLSRLVQVRVWAPDPTKRADFDDAITACIGNVANRRLTLPDGSQAQVFWHNGKWKDDSQQDFSMYTADIFYMIKYGVLQSSKFTQIGAIRTDREVGTSTLPSVYEG